MSLEAKPPDDSPMADHLTEPKSTIGLLALAKGVVGGIAGGGIGFFLFEWLTSVGLYSIILPGALLGLGFGLASQYKSLMFGVMCAIAAIGLGLFSEWAVFYSDNNSFPYFLSHLHQLGRGSLVMLAIGTLMAFWFGRGR